MSRKRTPDSNRSSSPSLVAPRVHRRPPGDAPPLTLQAGFVVALVASVVVLSYPVAAAVAVAAAVVGLLVTAAGRAVRRAAAREATVRVPLVGVEVTVARSAE